MLSQFIERAVRLGDLSLADFFPIFRVPVM